MIHDNNSIQSNKKCLICEKKLKWHISRDKYEVQIPQVMVQQKGQLCRPNEN